MSVMTVVKIANKDWVIIIQKPFLQTFFKDNLLASPKKYLKSTFLPTILKLYQF